MVYDRCVKGEGGGGLGGSRFHLITVQHSYGQELINGWLAR